jgi:CspA family cold shock protein
LFFFITSRKCFSNRKGYGFIEQEESDDLFVHHSAINMPGFRMLAEGDRVVFEIEMSDRGPAAKPVPFSVLAVLSRYTNHTVE